MNSSLARHVGFSLSTAFAVGCLAWIARVLGHELIGHGGACLLVGETPISFSAMYFQGSESASVWAGKFRLASGTIVNALTAWLFVWLLSHRVKDRSWLGYFLWVAAVMNLLQGGSYVAFGRFVHSGTDWAQFPVGLSPAWFWHGLEWVVGLALIWAGISVARRFEGRFAPAEAGPKLKRFVYLVPYLAAVVVSVSASTRVPSDERLLMVLGGFGNSFSFMLPMLVLPFLASTAVSATALDDSLGERRLGLTVAGMTAALVFVFVIGPGVTL